MSSDAALATSPPTTQDSNNRRKSGRAVRKPDLFADEHHEGSITSNGSVKRKRQQRSDAFFDQDDAEIEEEDLDDEDEGSADEEDFNERRPQPRSKKAASKPTTKRPKISANPSKTLAIRSANVPSKNYQKSKGLKARSRPSQVNQEGLYGTCSEKP